jgi:hypothetical protein
MTVPRVVGVRRSGVIRSACERCVRRSALTGFAPTHALSRRSLRADRTPARIPALPPWDHGTATRAAPVSPIPRAGAGREVRGKRRISTPCMPALLIRAIRPCARRKKARTASRRRIAQADFSAHPHRVACSSGIRTPSSPGTGYCLLMDSGPGSSSTGAEL